MPSAENVQMQMGDGLSAVAPAVDDETVPGLRQTFIGSDTDGGEHEFPRQAAVCVFQFRQTGDVATGDQQDMCRGLGVDVTEGQELFIAVHLGAWYFASGDITKKTGSHGFPSRWEKHARTSWDSCKT